MAMGGDAIIDAVASLIGMKAITADDVPSRAQVLVWVNAAAKDIAAEFPEKMWTLIDRKENTDSPHDAFVVLTVVVNGNNADEMPIKEFFTFKQTTGANRTDKVAWTYIDQGGSAGVRIELSQGSTYTIYFLVTPVYEDDASPSYPLPPNFETMLIERATAYGLLHERRDQAYLGLKGEGK